MVCKVPLPRIRQLFYVATAGLLSSFMMAIWGYPAAALPQWEAPDSVIHLDRDQSSWFASITLMMCIPCTLVGASLYEWLGPRKTMLGLTPPLGIFFMTMALASWDIVQEAKMAEIVLLTSRVIQSLIVGLLHPFALVYTYEICDQSSRGIMSSFIDVWATIGYLLSYLSGCFLSWEVIAIFLPVLLLVPVFIGLLFSAESPLWLIRVNRETEAKEILYKVRCTEKEVLADVEDARSNLNEKKLTVLETLSILTKKSHLKAIIASSLVLSVNQLGGFSIVIIYVVHIFDESGVGLSPSWSSVVVGIFRLVFSLFASFLVHKMPRRRMLLIGNSLTGLASAIIGTFFYLQGLGKDVSWLSWLPAFGLALYMAGYAGAVGPTTWTVGVELLPGPVRSAGYGIAATLYSATAFALTRFFLDMKDMIGLHGVFWLFACGSLSYILIVILYIPETFGKTVKEVEEYWENPTKNNPEKDSAV